MRRSEHPLRDLARGKSCQIRLPGCDGGGETTVLAHLRLAGITGAGQKAPDFLGAWACFHCHGIVDGHIKTDMESDFIRLAFYDGMARTQYWLIREEYVIAVVPGEARMISRAS